MTPEQLLFTDDDGGAIALEDLVDDGLDGDYQDRVPDIAALLDHADPQTQLHACRVLVSWGITAGFDRAMAWARDPARVPWAGHPVDVDRFHGVDAAFDRLADALRTSTLLDPHPDLQRHQIALARALLALYDRVYFGSSLAVAVGRPPLRDTCAADSAAAAEAATRAAAHGAPTFDLALQAASLLAVVAMADDDRAARLATDLLGAHGGRARVLQETIDSLAWGAGSATRRVLDDLAAAPASSALATAALARRASSTT